MFDKNFTIFCGLLRIPELYCGISPAFGLTSSRYLLILYPFNLVKGQLILPVVIWCHQKHHHLPSTGLRAVLFQGLMTFIGNNSFYQITVDKYCGQPNKILLKDTLWFKVLSQLIRKMSNHNVKINQNRFLMKMYK